MIDEWNWKGYSLTDGFRGEIGKPTTYATESWLRTDELYRSFTQNNRCSGVSYTVSYTHLSYTVGLLLDRHLIEECGRLQVPGRPRLYRTTQAFLRAFHLNSLEELPQLPGMEADGQLRLDDDTVPADGENGAEAL